jgi:hypothetical protein
MMRSLRAVVAVAMLGLGCGVPLQVTRLDPLAADPPPQAGMRFRLARPRFHLQLAMVEKGQPQLVVGQTLDDTPLVFEGQTAPSWLADTEVTIAVDADERLSSASAGEDDHTQDFVEAVIAVASKAAIRSGPPSAEACAGLSELSTGLAKFLREQDTRIDAREKAQRSLDACLESMLNCSARNAELERRTAAVESHRADLDAFARISLAGEATPLLDHPNPCFVVTLQEVL